MDWANESYVRVYTRETDDDIALSWEARAIWDALMKRFDRSGVFATKRGAKGLAAAVRIPPDVVARHLPELLEDGRLVEIDGGFIAPNFIAAQEAKKSDKLRQKEARERRRTESMDVTWRDGAVTPRDENVTRGHTASHDVTLCSADPHPLLCGADSSPSRAIPPTTEPAGARPDPDQERSRRQETRKGIWRELEAARGAVAAELGHAYMLLTAQDPGEKDLALLLAQSESLDAAAKAARHAIAVAREEALGKRSMQWFSGVIFEPRQMRRAAGVDPEKLRAARTAILKPENGLLDRPTDARRRAERLPRRRTPRRHAVTFAQWLEAIRRLPAPRTEARVLRAVITDPDKLALADDTCVDDFTHPGNARAFAHVRDLQATGSGVDVIAVCDADEMRRRAFQTTGENAMAIHLRDHVFGLAPLPYELEFGFGAAPGVFEADRHQLRAIADARKAACLSG